MKRLPNSLIAYVICTALILYAGNIHYSRWDKNYGESTFGWDAGTYYAYLPSLFIYKDLKTQHLTDSVKDKYKLKSSKTVYTKQDSLRVLNYSSGMALVYSPAFFIAHFISGISNYPQDGFSQPYQLAVSLYCTMIVLIGLWHFRRLLLNYYSDAVTAITIFLIAIGTNYFNYATSDVVLTHSILFTVYVFLLLATRRFYLKPDLKTAASIGLLYGLAILIRPSEMVAATMPLLWGLESFNLSSLKKHLSFLRYHLKYIGITIICTVLVGLIQCAYWYHVTGKLVYYSYEYGFFWDGRFLYNFLFSWEHGWLLYSPMMAFALIGSALYLFKGKHKIAIISFLLLNLYVTSAWEIWWYSGIPGRAMIQSYAILAFPFALLVEKVLSIKLIKWVFATLSATFLYFNMWLFHNAHLPPGLFDPEGMTSAYYRAVIGRWNVSKDVQKLKDSNELFTGTAKNTKLIYKQDFEKDTINTSPIKGINSNNGLYIDEHTSISQTYRIPHQNNEQAEYIRVSIDAIAPKAEWENWRMIQMIIRFIDDEGNLVKDNMLRLNRFVHGSVVKHIYLDTKIPADPYQSIEILFWNPGSSGIMLIDNLKVASFQE